MIVSGGCHCGKVRFEVELPEPLELLDCNCSICKKTGFLHLIVPRPKFTLRQGEEALTCYQFNTGVAEHTFCRHCGIKAFYTPRSNPDGIDVNARCLDDWPLPALITAFDGENWEHNAASLEHLSRE